MDIKEELLIICSGHGLLGNEHATVKEPYIPYIPKRWNGILALAEAQNHGSNSVSYLSWLRSLPIESKYQRLYLHPKKGIIGVHPWDDGSLKLAVESALDKKAENTAVSNAVLWSQVKKSGANVNPSLELQKLSSKIWSEFLGILKPKCIVSSGKIAGSVIDNTNWKGKHLKLRLPAKTAMSRISGMFNVNDLLKRYPEVEFTVRKHPDWIKNHSANKILFACHAVSIIKTAKKT